MIRLAYSCLFGYISLFLVWLTGYDFDERGFLAFYSGFIFTAVVGMALIWPDKYPGEK